jgi:hypothetical protein
MSYTRENRDKLTCGGAAVGRHRKEEAYSLSIEKVLERSREKRIIETRKQRIERLKVTKWKIWKLLGVTWQ